MPEQFDTRRILVLRKLTRAIAEHLRGQMRNHLSTLAPLLRPRVVLGDYVQSSTKEMTRGADKAFKELQSLYERIAPSKPFNLPPELNPPIEIVNTALEMTPMEYMHEARTERESKVVTVTSPLKWVLTYSGFPHARLRELASSRNRNNNELKEFILHYLVMHVVITGQPGITQILDALHFPITSERLPESGELPITCISSSISTVRPPDEVIIENTEISGMDAFEEVVVLDDITNMRSLLKDKLIEIVRSHDEKLPAQ